MSEFDELCENMGIMKKITRERYPREIKLSEAFLEALKKEYYDHKLEEDNERPVRNRPEKFAKALRFQITHLENTAAVELEAMKARYASEVEESNDERVPEVTVDGEKKKLPQNDAPENKEPTTQTLDKGRRLVLKRNVSSKIQESSGNVYNVEGKGWFFKYHADKRGPFKSKSEAIKAGEKYNKETT